MRTKEIFLTPKQIKELETLKTNTPQEANPIYGSGHWTSAVLGDHIKRTYKVQYKSKTSYYLIFKQAKFTYHKTGAQHAFKTLKENMVVTRKILEKIRTIYPQEKITLFWDSAGWHKGSCVREFIEQDGKSK